MTTAGKIAGEAIPGARATLIVFSAGLIAQVVLFAVTCLVRQLWKEAEGPTLGSFIFAFTYGNALAFVWSLLPMTSRSGQPTDGRVLLQLAIDRWHGRTVIGGTLPSMNAAAQSPVFTPDTTLLGIPSLVPPDFKQGVEILNDTHTPLEFVIDVLMRHLEREGRQAINDAVEIHNRGGLLVPLGSMVEAERVATAIACDAAAAGLQFVCRAVKAQTAAPTF